MGIAGVGFSQTYYHSTAAQKRADKDSEGQKPANCQNEEPTGKKRLINGGGRVTDAELKEANPGAIPEKGAGAPYSYLADETGMIDYKGVIFVCDNERKELCLGDMSNRKDVIRIPLSEGGCLMVNRDNIGQLSEAITMFSPEDINLILRALRADSKIQEMQKEIEDMEENIGKSNDETFADSTESAKETAQENGKGSGFNGYEPDAGENTAPLSPEQLDMLTRDIVSASLPGRGSDSFPTSKASQADSKTPAGEKIAQRTSGSQGGSHTVYMKTDDMLYSGGNGTGLSFYIKYAEGSTPENPVVTAKGVDENGHEFEQTFSLNNINIANATIVEMSALEAHYNVDKGKGGLTSLPMEAGAMGLGERHNFVNLFEQSIQDMNTLGKYDLVLFYMKNLNAYQTR